MSLATSLFAFERTLWAVVCCCVITWAKDEAFGADAEAGCAALRAHASASAEGAGVPYLAVGGHIQPSAGERREESLRVGLEMNVADLVRQDRLFERAEADCARLKAEQAAEATALGGPLLVELAGLDERRVALEQAIAAASANLAERNRRLAAFHDTRGGVGHAAQEVAFLKQDLLDTIGLAERVRRQAAAFPATFGDANAVIAELGRAATAAYEASAADRRGPAWDVTLGYGWTRTKYVGADDTVWVEGDPSYLTLGLKWRPAVAFVRDVPRDAVQKADKLGRDVQAWDQDRATLARTYEAKVALAEVRLSQVKADLAIAADGKLPDTKDYLQQLQREERSLGIDIADWGARLAALGGRSDAAFERAADLGTRVFSSVDRLVVTEGEAEARAGGAFASRGAKVRARVDGAKGATAVRAEFKYVGPTAEMQPLESGAARRQLGVFLAAKNQCNLLYAMWRLPADGIGPGEIVVQRKVNVGMETHEQCGNGGYQTVRATTSERPSEVKPGESHALEAVLEGSRLSVLVDGKSLWEGEVNVAGLDPADGSVGWRSDNVRAEFKLAVGEGAP